ncbi:Glycosyl transferase family 2 [Mucilaginibacter pineti]|uniref:Glycosyl transferase family 2 n=1 Tax=Mucilaginibacter pineti TaxID=1391627 RepID=A0A1G6ZLS3_9SPHI|nr:glycosyltransferase family 2 protein [Mucilaginibacter pineti]SDE03598.1 Glycosyl transferase family 2 [Mucilaginibacter pineti]
MLTELAIVIPAYKSNFLETALDSIVAQTNHNFIVYVSDDGSREDLLAIVNLYKYKLNIEYYRFPDNLGRKDLVGHWNRSVRLSAEKWVWLFSDDDVLSPGCVEAFYRELEATGAAYNLYRFNIEMIDSIGATICIKQPHPVLESAYGFLTGRLQSRSLSAAVEYIFRKEVFDKYQGFVNFPSAYCADDASWLIFADDQLIFTIQAEKVYWRASGINISAGKTRAFPKAQALLQFIAFVTEKFSTQRSELLAMAYPWFFENLLYIQGRLSVLQSVQLSRKFCRIMGGREMDVFKKIFALQYRYTRFASFLQKWSGY